MDITKWSMQLPTALFFPFLLCRCLPEQKEDGKAIIFSPERDCNDLTHSTKKESIVDSLRTPYQELKWSIK